MSLDTEILRLLNEKETSESVDETSIVIDENWSPAPWYRKVSTGLRMAPAANAQPLPSFEMFDVDPLEIKRAA